MKKLIVVLLVTLLSLSLFAQGATEKKESGPVIIKLVEQMPEGHIMADTMHYLAGKIEEYSKGSIKCEIFTGGVLGDDTATYEAIISGAADITRLELTTAVNFGAKKASVAALPYIIRDRDHFWKIANSAVGKELMDSIQEDGTGMVALNLIEEGSRHFFMSKPVAKLTDLKGKKIRVQNTEFWIEIIKSLNASPTPMSFGELYQALQTGVVDGAEQPLSGYVSQRFYEVCPHLILDGHVYPIETHVFSEKNWKKLSKEHQDVVLRAAADTMVYNRNTIQAAEDEIMKNLSSLGVKVYPVDDKGPWQEAVKPVYAKFGTPEVLSLLDKIRDIK